MVDIYTVHKFSQKEVIDVLSATYMSNRYDSNDDRIVWDAYQERYAIAPKLATIEMDSVGSMLRRVHKISHSAKMQWYPSGDIMFFNYEQNFIKLED